MYRISRQCWELTPGNSPDFGSSEIGRLKMNDTFIATIKARRDEARNRVEEARKELANAEAEASKWDAVLELEFQHSRTSGNGTSGRAVERRPLLTLDDVRTKANVLRNVLYGATQPLTRSKIVKRVQPAVSRSAVYYLIDQLRDSGEIAEVDGKFILKPERTKKEVTP